MTDDKAQVEDVKTWLRNLGCSEVAVEEINDAIFRSARRTDALQAERDKLSARLRFAEDVARKLRENELVAMERALSAEWERDKLSAEVEQWRSDNPPDYASIRAEIGLCQTAEAKLTALVEADRDMRLLLRVALDALEPVGTALHIVFDGMPGPEGPRFVEVETPDGRSINAGEWRKREDGFCELVIPRMSAPPTTPTSAPTEGAQLRPRAELLEMIDAMVAAWIVVPDPRGHETYSVLSEAAERIRADTASLTQAQGEERSTDAPENLGPLVDDWNTRSNHPQEERSDPLGLAAADDNHKALVEALDGGLLSTSSQGHPEPAKRNAMVRVEYFGEGSLAKAHRLADTLAVFIDSQAEKLP